MQEEKITKGFSFRGNDSSISIKPVLYTTIDRLISKKCPKIKQILENEIPYEELHKSMIGREYLSEEEILAYLSKDVVHHDTYNLEVEPSLIDDINSVFANDKDVLVFIRALEEDDNLRQAGFAVCDANGTKRVHNKGFRIRERMLNTMKGDPRFEKYFSA